MNPLPKTIFCWSGGKDSAYCLHKVLSEKLYDVKYLLTTINGEFKRVSMHGVQEALLDKQIEAVGIPVLKVRVYEGNNDEYEKQMKTVLLKAKAEGISEVIFGDIFLEDLRTYREKNLEKIGMKAIFPLWKMDTVFLINDFIKQGFKSITCCINDGYLTEDWVGREINEQFINQLPDNVDPCGENGEYHSYCYAGPIFKTKINFRGGKKVYKALKINISDEYSSQPNIITKGFWFYDLIPN